MVHQKCTFAMVDLNVREASQTSRSSSSRRVKLGQLDLFLWEAKRLQDQEQIQLSQLNPSTGWFQCVFVSQSEQMLIFFSLIKAALGIAKLHSGTVLSVGKCFFSPLLFPIWSSQPKIPLCAALSPSSGSDQHYHHHHERCCSPDDSTLQLLDSSHLHLSSQEFQSDGTAHSTSRSTLSHCSRVSAMKNDHQLLNGVFGAIFTRERNPLTNLILLTSIQTNKLKWQHWSD